MKARAKAVWSIKNKSGERAAQEKKVPKAQRNGPGRKANVVDLASRTLEQLAEAQGVKPLTDPTTLMGGWPQEDDLDEFLEEVYRTRSMQ